MRSAKDNVTDEGQWIGVDLDGCLAEGTHSLISIGDPIPLMYDRVKQWIKEGKDIRIFTARVAKNDPQQFLMINDWCKQWFGKELPITCKKDLGCMELWDDKAIRVERNTGRIIGEINESNVGVW